MVDPKLTRSSVQINYTANDGYRAEFGVKSGKGNRDLITKETTEPENALLAGLEEIARLTALFGFEDRALQVFNEARARVAEWRQAA